MQLVEPDWEENEPGEQSVQLVEPDRLEKDPAAHGMQGCCPSALKVPGGQGWASVGTARASTANKQIRYRMAEVPNAARHEPRP